MFKKLIMPQQYLHAPAIHATYASVARPGWGTHSSLLSASSAIAPRIISDKWTACSYIHAQPSKASNTQLHARQAAHPSAMPAVIPAPLVYTSRHSNQ
jgi:hypothetical protein